MTVNVNSDNRTRDILTDLKRHLASCRDCRSALKARNYDGICKITRTYILSAAQQFDTVIPRRLAAARRQQHIFYACPDLAAHSRTYAMTAEPLIATGVQEGLF